MINPQMKQNTVDGGANQRTDRFNLSGGWYMTNNVLAKLEYVKQTYSGEGYANSIQYKGGKFSGIMIEEVIGF